MRQQAGASLVGSRQSEKQSVTIWSATIRTIQSTCGSLPSNQPKLTHLCPPGYKPQLRTHLLQECSSPWASCGGVCFQTDFEFFFFWTLLRIWFPSLIPLPWNCFSFWLLKIGWQFCGLVWIRFTSIENLPTVRPGKQTLFNKVFYQLHFCCLRAASGSSLHLLH